MTTGNPLISIITVTFNAVDTIGRTMDSVASQTATDYEHLIMDGVSRDNTLSIVERTENPRIRIFSSIDHGIYDAMNKAMGVARGDYYIFMNAGDTFADSETLARFIEAIKTKSRPGIVYGQTVLVDNDGKILGKRHLKAPKKLTLESFRNGMVVCHQAMAVKRDIAPLYDTSYHFSADYEWAIRVLQHSRQNCYLGDKPVVHYLAEGTTTQNHYSSLRERFRIMCRYYGTASTIVRHAKFMIRYIGRHFNHSANKQ